MGVPPPPPPEQKSRSYEDRAPVYRIGRFGKVLRGWKPIAEYLGVGTRTAQRYHQQFGMPVVRITGRRVWTTVDAITKWIASIDRFQREEGLSQPGAVGSNAMRRYTREIKGRAGARPERHAEPPADAPS